MASAQVPGDLEPSSWTVSLSPSWDVLGPFPIHAREQHFLSPSYPLNLSCEIDFAESHPSSLADCGGVSWTKFSADPTTGTLEKHQFIGSDSWSRIRQTEGWAGLQHHSVLHTVLTIFPPTNLERDRSSPPPRLHVNLVQGSFFTILPKSGSNRVPKWHSGNVYAMERSLPRMINLPSFPSLTSPTTYDVYVSGDYEIRLFGDPQVYNGNDTPTLTVGLSVDIKIPQQTVERVLSFDIVPDFIDGWAFGDAIGLFLRNHSSDRWMISSVTLNGEKGLDLRLLRHTVVQPSQTRVIPVEILQIRPLRENILEFTIHATSASGDLALPVSLPIRHLPHWSTDASPNCYIKSTYLYSGFTPTAFLVKPPLKFLSTPQVPVVALHGAGVDIFHLPFWRDALPRQTHSWTIIPSGRTSWGLDWHGPSSAEVWYCVGAFEKLLSDKNLPWASWGISLNSRAVLVGHSNGGQGTWYISERFPDRVVAAAPAAGYIKSQAYVPLTQSHARHFIDPALNSILESTLTPDDNDLFLSNLVGIPILVIHGGNDENVPTWHARSLFNTLKSLHPVADIMLKEDPGQPHWYPWVFDNEVVQGFIQKHAGEASASFAEKCSTEGSFTFTVAVPSESDTLCGLRIEKLSIPGRLGKLRVFRNDDDTMEIRSTNVKQFTMIRESGLPEVIDVEGQVVSRQSGKSFVRFSKGAENAWMATYPGDHVADIQPSGRLSLILSSKGPLLFVIPDEDDLSLSYALRLAHDLDTFHKLDVEILTDTEVGGLLEGGSLGPSNMVVFDGPKKTSLGRRLLGGSELPPLPTCVYQSEMKSNGAIFLYKHPTHSDAVTLFLRAGDEAGMENILRLFPIRTGVFGPDWMVISPVTATLGAAGVIGAGSWADRWECCEDSSWTT